MGIRCSDHVTPLYKQKLALTSPNGGGLSVDIVRLRTKAKEFFITDHQVSPSGARRVYFTFPHSASLRFIIVVHYHLGRCIERDLFPSGLRLKFCMLFSPFSLLLHAPSISLFFVKFSDREVCLVNNTIYKNLSLKILPHAQVSSSPSSQDFFLSQIFQTRLLPFLICLRVRH